MWGLQQDAQASQDLISIDCEEKVLLSWIDIRNLLIGIFIHVILIITPYNDLKLCVGWAETDPQHILSTRVIKQNLFFLNRPTQLLFSGNLVGLLVKYLMNPWMNFTEMFRKILELPLQLINFCAQVS